MGNAVNFDQKIANMPQIRVMQKSPVKRENFVVINKSKSSRFAVDESKSNSVHNRGGSSSVRGPA